MQQNSSASSAGGPAGGKKRRDERMLHGTTTLMAKIYVDASAAQEEVQDAVTIKNYEPIASYSWKDIDHPTIYVPGLPTKLSTPSLPAQLSKDNLTRPNPRSPAAAMDPLFEAVLHQHPSFSMSPIQLVSDRNSLRNILSFASSLQIPGSSTWRVDVDIIHDTMFINQWEEFRLSMINPNRRQDSGYGHALEELLTARGEEMRDSIHHERIVKYDLGGLECLVKFEADAYLDIDDDASGNGGSREQDSQQETILSPPDHDPTAPEPSEPVLRPPYKLVHTISRGHDIKPSLIAEIKSCFKSPGNNKKLDMKKIFPQLWFSQTKHLCIGYHDEGLVTAQPDMRNMADELEKWEVGNQKHLRNMVRVIKEIREVARKLPAGRKRATVVCSLVDGVRCLSVFERMGMGMAIRPEVVERCWRTGAL